MCALRALCIVTIVTLWLWRQGLLHNHVRTKTIMCALRALKYCWPLWRLIVTSRLVATWCHRLECPPGWSDPLSRVSCAVSLDPGNGSLYPGGHFCPSPVNSRLFTDDYSRLPRIAGSSLNHMIRNCPTTSQETFNDGYNNYPSDWLFLEEI